MKQILDELRLLSVNVVFWRIHKPMTLKGLRLTETITLVATSVRKSCSCLKFYPSISLPEVYCVVLSIVFCSTGNKNVRCVFVRVIKTRNDAFLLASVLW